MLKLLEDSQAKQTEKKIEKISSDFEVQCHLENEELEALISEQQK